MKNRTKRLPRAKVLAVLLAVMLCFSVIGISVGCSNTGGDTTDPAPYEFTPPALVPKVHSVAITYNDDIIQGVRSVDISLQSIKVGAVVSKDDDATGTLTFESSVTGVATIDNQGNVALLATGETVLTAKYGGEKCSVVLAVEDGYVGRYTVAVNGGSADKTSVEVGDIVTITPIIPEHMEFSEWSFVSSGASVTWISGNMFKMPAGNVSVKASFIDKLYSLKLVGAKVTDDGSENVKKGTVIGYDGSSTDEYAITEYKYPYNTTLSFEAVKPSPGRMFVGWDQNIVNNRLDEEQAISDFVMPDETTTFWANFSDIKQRRLLTADAINNWTSTLIDGANADAVFEGFSGYTITIPAGKGRTDGFNEDIHGSVLNTVVNSSQAIRAIFRNRGDKDVTVEIYASYLTNLATSGWVTVPAGGTVTKTFIALLGFQANPWWGFSLRENVGAGSNVPLDIVMGCADAYPKGDKTLAVTSGTKLVTLDYYRSLLGSSGANINNTYAWTLVTRYEHDAGTAFPNIMSARLTNLPAYNANDPYVTLYIKMLNQSGSDHTYTYKFAFGKNENPLDENYELKEGSKAVDFTVSNHGETKMFAIRVPRSETDNDFYFSMIKLQYDTEDNVKPAVVAPYYALNYSVVLTYNNGMGFTGEVTQ